MGQGNLMSLSRFIVSFMITGFLLLRGAESGSDFLVPDSVEPDGSGNYIVSYTMNITLSYGAPSCFARPIILVSGVFEGSIAINQYDTLRVTLINNIPASYPSVMDGISIHWHGLHMFEAPWFDGVGYVSMCPLRSGESYTFQFKVYDTPGTYFWHDHVGGFKGDGLYGGLIVYPRRAPLSSPTASPPWPPAALPTPWSYDGEHVLLLSDWYHTSGSSLFMRVNRPLPSLATQDSGYFEWVGNPQTLLINGRGFYGDCQLPGDIGGDSHVPVTCDPKNFTVPPGRNALQPWASANNPGCTHSEFVVEQGKTYRMRLINSALLVYLTVCFESHVVTVIAADGVPTAPFSAQCVDVHAGQRLDLLLTANMTAANYWITIVSNVPGRTGTPAGYATLRYNSSSMPAETFPVTPAPQPKDIAVQYTETKLVMSPMVLDNISYAKLVYTRERNPLLQSPAYANGSLAPPKTATKMLVFNTQPILFSSGEVKYGLNSVASPQTPPCKSLLHELRKNPKYLERMAVPASQVNGTGMGPNFGAVNINSSNPFPVFMNGLSPVPINPSVGLHVIPLSLGDIVDIVINNLNMGSTEHHPFHLHGHRFWVLGHGEGVFNAATDTAKLNTVNPLLRDTVSVYHDGWAYLRFWADNPGIWPMHCHILPHLFLGQQVHFVLEPSKTVPPPKTSTKCPKTCRYNFSPYNKSWLRDVYGASGWEVPPME